VVQTAQADGGVSAATSRSPSNGRGKATSSANAAPRWTKSKAAGVIRFRDDAGNGWVGRGKRPNWFKAALAACKTPEDLAVN